MDLFLKHKKKIIALILVLFSYLAFDYVYPSGTWRYRITVEVETPEGIRSGSAVREVYVMSEIISLPESHPHTEVKGEAVVVDLGKRGTLFALIDWDSYYEVFKAFPIPFGGGGTTARGIKYYRSLKPGKKAELNARRPHLVTFGDLDDPASLKNLSYGNLNDTFGEGVHIRKVIVEITDDPVTSSIDELIARFGGKSGMYKQQHFKRGF